MLFGVGSPVRAVREFDGGHHGFVFGDGEIICVKSALGEGLAVFFQLGLKLVVAGLCHADLKFIVDG